MKNSLLKFLFLLVIGAFVSCNPDCENFARVEAILTPQDDAFLITTNVPNFLDDRTLYTERLVNGELVVNESTIVNTTPADGGHLISASDLGEGNYSLYAVDNDCGGFIPLSTSLNCSESNQIEASISPVVRLPGQEVLITTNPAELLRNKTLMVQRPDNGQIIPLQSQYNDVLEGHIAVLPLDVTGEVSILVEDDVCNGMMSLNSIRVADQSYISRNPALFVSPTPPTIVIPPPTITPPTNIVNTWFSPDNRDYCIWFFPSGELVDDNGILKYKENSQLKTGQNVDFNPGQDFNDLSSVDFSRLGSFEVATGCPEAPESRPFYSTKNPISGVINKETGAVFFEIDRSQVGLGTEAYSGNIVQTSSLPAYAQYGGVCAENSSIQSATIMVVTSQKTNKQMILYRQFVGAGIPDNLLIK